MYIKLDKVNKLARMIKGPNWFNVLNQNAKKNQGIMKNAMYGNLKTVPVKATNSSVICVANT